MDIVPIQERWVVFLSKIEERFQETLTQAAAILPSLLDYREFDTHPFATAWQGIETQSKELIAKIADTWHEKVSPALEEVKEAEEQLVEDEAGGLDKLYEKFYPLYYAERDKGLALRGKLDKELKAYEVRTFSAAARKLVAKAQEILSKDFLCTQCKAPLPVKASFFRSYYQTCEYCQTVNSFEPGTVARNVEHFAMHPLAEEKALDEYFAYWDIEQQFKSQRDDEPASVTPQALLDVYKIYATKYLQARIEIVPEYRQQYEKDLASKIEHIRKWVLGEHGLNFTGPAGATALSPEKIAKIFWQMLNYYYPEGGTLDGEDNIEITTFTCLADFENDMDPLVQEVEETFGIYIGDDIEKTVGELINYIHDQGGDVVLGDNVDADGNWRCWEELE